MLTLDPIALLSGGTTPVPHRQVPLIAQAQQVFPPLRHSALRRALSADPEAYGRTRNRLDGAVTALSPYVTHGIVGEAELSQLWIERFGLTLDDKLLLELAWRAFFQDVWRKEGEGILKNLRPSCLPGIHYQPQLPQDILEARTGVRVIDASVRRLYSDGYLHNHQRMWLASYCVHMRKVAWRVAADWMYGHLLDGDLASNHLSWQWVAGTFSARPYLFNAENVARFAPYLASPETSVDCSYDMMAAIAHSNVDVGPENGSGLNAEAFSQRGVRKLSAAIAQPGGESPPRLLSRPPRVLPPVDFERLARGRELALLHPWDLSGRPAAERVIGIIHQPYHVRFPWSEKRWDFVLGRMSTLCDAIWVGDLSQLPRVLAAASKVSVSEALQPGYVLALPRLCDKPQPRAHWLPPAPVGTPSFSAYLKFLRREMPQLFRARRNTARRLHA